MSHLTSKQKSTDHSENDQQLYININSNHPPSIKKALPNMISNRLGVPEGQTDERVGCYTSRNATCCMRLVSRQIEGHSQEQRELY